MYSQKTHNFTNEYTYKTMHDYYRYLGIAMYKTKIKQIIH